MALTQYKIDQFMGIDQSCEENFLKPGYTADAQNMDTENGSLRVARGFSRMISYAVPGTETIHRLLVFRHNNGDMYLVFAGDSIYVSNGGPWISVYTANSLIHHKFDTVEANISGKDYIIIGNGEHALIKFDGETFSAFGSVQGGSTIPVRYMGMYKNRLFSAGDRLHPNRLYWSQLPGDGRTIEIWNASAASVNVEGGFVEVGNFDNDPIVALCPLSGQLLIFKKNSLYRLYGEKPSNFALEEVEANLPPCVHTSIIHYGDVAYFMTNVGLYVFDGVNAYLTADALCIRNILSKASTENTRACRTRDKLYFTVKHNNADALLEYDLRRHTYMLRNGFSICDMVSRDNEVLFVNDKRYVYKLNNGTTYDGEAINAYWTTPETDFGEKSTIKLLREMYFRSENTQPLKVHTTIGGVCRTHIVDNPKGEVSEVPLLDEGRMLKIKFENIAGSAFALKGGVEVVLSMRGRCM